jgi:hypothetical protein
MSSPPALAVVLGVEQNQGVRWNPLPRPMRRAAMALALPCLLATSCDEGPPAPLKKRPAGEPWYALGQGEEEFNALEDGDEIIMVLGGQGSLMFPMPFQGGGFTLPDDPSDWQDPDAPVLNLTFDVEGHNTGFGGHFFRLNNYPLPVEVQSDGSYEFLYVTVFVPDELENICDVHGEPAEIRSTLQVAGREEPLVFDLDVIIEVPPIYDEPCE